MSIYYFSTVLQQCVLLRHTRLPSSTMYKFINIGICYRPFYLIPFLELQKSANIFGYFNNILAKLP